MFRELKGLSLLAVFGRLRAAMKNRSISQKMHQTFVSVLLRALLNLGMIFFEKGAPRPFQRKSYMKSATPFCAVS